MNRSFKTIILITFLGLILAPAAAAHKVTIFAWAEGDMVYTESKFSGGKAVMDGKVEVFDPSGALLLEGRTDDNGQFAFKAPQIIDLNIVLTAGMGHKNSWKLTAVEIGGAPQPEPSPAPTADMDQPPSSSMSPGATIQEIEAIVARQIDQKIQPLTRMVAELQDQGPSISDILGGIGYIIGLVGLGAYLRYRKESHKP